ncbi:MAG: hypothetical protein ACOYKM_01430 [Caulobacterales bacterium]|jgi:hypothetical protein
MTTILRRSLFTGLAIGAGAALAGQAAAQPSSGGATSEDLSRSQQRLTSAASFVPLPRATAPVMTRFGPRGTLVAEMCLDVPEAALRGRITAIGPRLRDAMRQALATYASVHLRPGAPPDADQLARMMQQSVDRSLGQAGARLLITDLILQQA